MVQHRGEAVAAGGRAVGRDSISVDFSPAVLMLRADRGDKAGKLIGADGRRTTIKVVPERMADLDVDGFARKFLATQRAAAERSRLLSPRDTAQDLVRVPVKFGEQPGEALERFTISIEPQEAGGVIYMAWDTRRVAATFQVL